VTERVVNQLLTEMNGVDDLENIFLIGATNRPEIIDRAILRPERLGVHLYVPLPSQIDRVKILNTICSKKPLNEDVDIQQLVEKFGFEGFSGADLNSLVETAARKAAWESEDINEEFLGIRQVEFEKAAKEIKPSVGLKERKYYDKLKDDIFK
jgi:ribosome biogenesis ATPase